MLLATTEVSKYSSKYFVYKVLSELSKTLKKTLAFSPKIYSGWVVRQMDTKFIRDRITQLRIQKGVSEYKMSYDLGHSRSYIYNISSGKSLPPMAEFLEICDYLGVTPSEFFNDNFENPILVQSAVEEIRKLDDDDLLLVISNVRRLNKDK